MRTVLRVDLFIKEAAMLLRPQVVYLVPAETARVLFSSVRVLPTF